MLNLFVGLDIYTGLLLLLILAFVLFYETINGFHSAANAVITVIYTRAMQPQLAVVMATFFNFFGMLLGRFSVTYATVYMLPTDLLLNMGLTHGLAMVFSMLLTAIIQDLGTWFFGSLAFSPHTSIGAIIDIGSTNAPLTSSSVMDTLNLREVTKIFSSLVVSPIAGLVIAGGLVPLLRRYWSGTKKRDRIHRIPEDRRKKKGKRKPPFWTRIALIVSVAGVVFSYGANDGQEGIGLVMLVSVGITPAGLVISTSASGYKVTRTRDAVTNFEHHLRQYSGLSQKLIAMEPPLPVVLIDGTQVTEFRCHPVNTFDAIAHVKAMLPGNIESYEPLNVNQRSQLYRIMLYTPNTSVKLVGLPGVSKEGQDLLKRLRSDMLSIIEYAPVRIIVVVTLALGTSTMAGWRRVAMTIGERIGKRGMTYV